MKTIIKNNNIDIIVVIYKALYMHSTVSVNSLFHETAFEV